MEYTPETIYRCGRCGGTHDQEKMVVVRESDCVIGVNDGFLGIRHEYCGGKKAARRAVLRHLRVIRLQPLRQPSSPGLPGPVKDWRERGMAINTTLYSTSQAAVQLNISSRRVRALAKSRQLGITIGRAWVFTQADIDAMRKRVNGRPQLK
jgi:hypothetical protein